MTRVSEGSSLHAINYSIGKSKSKLENLQLGGANLKRIQRPSDDPIGNTKILEIRSQKIDSDQFLRNASMAKAQLTYTENAIEELTDLLSKAKELAIGQASNLFDIDIRRSVAKEVNQLRNQALSISNRRLGNKFIFAGFKSLTRPFDQDGKYKGDTNQSKVEVNKDFFVPISFNGKQIFYEKENTALIESGPLDSSPLQNLNIQPKLDGNGDVKIQRTPANTFGPKPLSPNDSMRSSIFTDLESLENALLTDNHEIIQGLLPKFDDSLSRIIEVRTQLGSSIKSIEIATENIERTTLLNAEYKSKIEDADVAELFTDLSRQKNIMDATYKASAQLMSKSLMDFVR